MAIKTFEEYVRHYTQSDWSFYVHLLPTIIGWALETEFYHHPVNLLEQGEETTNELTSEYVRWLLSNAFFLNLHSLRMTFLTQKRTIGALDFSIIFKDHNALAVGRILCQLSYFYQEAQNQSLSRVIKFDRYVVMDPPDWSNDQTLVHSTVINVQSNGMEASQGMGFVDFANKDLHIGTIISSLTQEEVLFSCCPECFVGLLFTEQFRSDEVMIISGVRRYSKYQGYQRTFQWTGFYPDLKFHDVVVIDANHRAKQFSSRILQRDLNKAWYSFLKCPSTIISTGHWGCGIFGGDKTLKFLQQLCAATLTMVTLDYSTFNDERCKEEFDLLLKTLDEGHVTIGELYQTMEKYGEIDDGGRRWGRAGGDDGAENGDLERNSFRDFLIQELSSKRSRTNRMLLIGGSSLVIVVFGFFLVKVMKW
eukprot:TRINITY_DN4320_c0_g1_i4.p1 TRINITY_DN4320_c0_g1~~TRINITY_DN4320_c0_g1_i4.p1  ORF type:complete len:421 (+),score=105.92 TRINITY_DN4320_c0_g1_i4:1484-2746(+)